MIYILIILLIIIGIINFDLQEENKIRQMPLFYIIGLLLFLIASFRYYNGGDTKNYVLLFKHISTIENLHLADLKNSRFQPGFLYFISYLKSIYNNFFIQQVTLSLIVNLTVFRFIKAYSSYLFFTILCYFLLNYFEFNMEIERECISVSMGLIAYDFFQNKHYLFAVLAGIIAYEFHVSALIIILIPFFSYIGFTKKSFLIILAFSIFLPSLYMAVPNLRLYASLLFNQQNWLVDSYIQQNFSKTLTLNYYVMHIIKYVIIPFGMIWYVNKRVVFKFNGLVYAYSLLQLLSMFSYAFYRFANYFAPFYWILIATAMCIYLEKRRTFRLIGVVSFIVLFLYMYQNVQLQWDSAKHRYFYNRYIPYNTILFNQGY